MKHTLLLLTALPLFLFAQSEKGVNPVKTPSSGGGGATRAVVIGISDYQDVQIPDLRFAHRDAEAFANFLKSPAGGSLDGDHLQVLLNQNATAGRVAEALDALVEQTKEGDEVIIYFSGHGDVERKTVSQPGFLLCWDAPSRVYMGGGTYSLAYLQEIVTTLSTQNKAKVVVVTDACHAGKLAGSQIGGSQLTAASMAKQFSNEVKILSCQPGELSLEGEQWGGGRGIFSYHLIDGLFGLADRNADGQVSLGELDRYLEDKVTAEAAPQSQVPMLLGNKTERLATVNATVLADLKKAKERGLPVFAATEGRGFEDDILSKLDSGIIKSYFAFKKAVAEKRFFPSEENPTAGQSADEIFAQLSENESLVPLRGMMKRNYAAALQDDAQQAMNIWLQADVQKLDCIGNSLKTEPIPRQLGRAAELLGEGHYMYRSLQARKLLFEGILLHFNTNPDEAIGREALQLFQKSATLEPNSPLPWHRMCIVHAVNFRQPDSAFACAEAAQKLAPNWVLPFSDLSFYFRMQQKSALAERALRELEKIDPAHPLFFLNHAELYGRSPEETEKALALLDQYRQQGGPMYPCWHVSYALRLKSLGKFAEAEAEFQTAIALDSNKVEVWSSLGSLYADTGRFAEAQTALEKAVALNPTFFAAWNNLGHLYLNTGNFGSAETAFTKAIELDSTVSYAWDNLAKIFLYTKREDKAVACFKKAIALHPTEAIHWSNLGSIHLAQGRYAEAELAFKKSIELNIPQPGGVYRALGNVYFKTNRLADARQQYLKVIELDPNARMTRLDMAALLVVEGKNSEALYWIEQAILKKVNFEQLLAAPDLAPLRALPEWKALMKKHFPDKIKD